MNTKRNLLRIAFLTLLLVVASSQTYATADRIIRFTASGVTNTIDSVNVKNITKGITVTVPNGNTLTLTDLTTGITDHRTEKSGIRITKNASNGTSTLTFYAVLSGTAQLSVYTLDGRKVLTQTTYLESGEKSLELTLPTGMYGICVTGKGYEYSAKLFNQVNAVTKAQCKVLDNTSLIASSPKKSKAMTLPSTILNYSEGDLLLYTASSSTISTTYIASVPDLPIESKTIDFKFFKIPTSAIPSGTFAMGSATTEVGRYPMEKQHSVTLSDFHISKYEITNSQYADFLNAKHIGLDCLYASGTYPTQPLMTTDYISRSLDYNGTLWMPKGDHGNDPVDYVTWFGAVEYATWVGGTLPTEAQWEYACRAGTTTPFSTGDFLTNLQANYNWQYTYNGGVNTKTTSPGTTQPVGTYDANTYGLYDMHGNIMEWCLDWYGTYLTIEQTNPLGAETGTQRVVRGGSWLVNPGCCRSAFRIYYTPRTCNNVVGFRVAFAQ